MGCSEVGHEMQGDLRTPWAHRVAGCPSAPGASGRGYLDTVCLAGQLSLMIPGPGRPQEAFMLS